MDPVRLAIDVGPLYGHRTGIGAAVAELVAALDEHPGVELLPYLLSFRTRPQPPARRLPLPAALAHRLWARSDTPRVDRWLGAAQVVHGSNYVVPPSRLPAVVSVYDCWFLANPELASPDVRRAGQVLRRRVAAGAVVHASSHATAAQLTALLGARDIEVVHLGPLPVEKPPAQVRAAWRSELAGRPFVLALGTVERRKNLPALAASFAAAAVDGAALVIAGAPGDDTDALDIAVERLPADARVRVIRPGAIRDDEKAWLLHHAGLLAYPSLDEGFGFPILEAQTVGVPVVATRAGSIPEVAGRGAELVPVGDGDALAAAITRVLDDDSRRRELVAAGHENLARFSWSATAEALVGVYRRLAGAHVTKVAVLCGGVGAARFLRGLQQVVEPAHIAAIVNTGDDTVMHGLSISPDLDTITYTLAGAIDPERGWGLVGETWRAMAALERYTAATWFNLGDKDLATHLYRTARLAEGATPTAVAAEVGTAWELAIRLLPMTDDRLATVIELASGEEVSFQDYFVRLRHSVPVRAVRFAGDATPTSKVLDALSTASTIVVAPSNPIVSIGPVRSLPGIDDLLTRRRDHVVAVSPIVGGAALKGPADHMLAELGHEPSVVGVARLYAPIAAALVIDPVDADRAADVEAAGMRAVVTPSVMSTPEVAADLARATLAALA